MRKIVENVFRFPNETFYGENVGVYLIECIDKTVLFDLPKFSTDNLNFIQSFNKPVECYLSHGSCGISDGTKWQEVGIKVYLHKGDERHPWLMMVPDELLSFENTYEINRDLELIHTPGHSDGSICMFHKPTKSIFTGDSLYGDARGNIYMDEPNPERYHNVAKQLIECQPENILPFHYEMIWGSASESIKSFLKYRSLE